MIPLAFSANASYLGQSLQLKDADDE
jgi:hypothetical protein